MNMRYTTDNIADELKKLLDTWQKTHPPVYDFIEEKIASPIFRIKEDAGLFVTDEFVETVRQSDLKGFGFRRLWNSELGRVHSEISINNLFLSEEEDYNW